MMCNNRHAISCATVDIQINLRTSADVCSFFLILALAFFSVADAADGREGEGKVGGAEGGGEEGTVLLASPDLRPEFGPIRELRRSDFSGGTLWPITFPNMVNTLITSSHVTSSAKSKTLADVPEATLTWIW